MRVCLLFMTCVLLPEGKASNSSVLVVKNITMDVYPRTLVITLTKILVLTKKKCWLNYLILEVKCQKNP